MEILTVILLKHQFKIRYMNKTISKYILIYKCNKCISTYIHIYQMLKENKMDGDAGKEERINVKEEWLKEK